MVHHIRKKNDIVGVTSEAVRQSIAAQEFETGSVLLWIDLTDDRVYSAR